MSTCQIAGAASARSSISTEELWPGFQNKTSVVREAEAAVVASWANTV